MNCAKSHANIAWLLVYPACWDKEGAVFMPAALFFSLSISAFSSMHLCVHPCCLCVKGEKLLIVTDASNAEIFNTSSCHWQGNVSHQIKGNWMWGQVCKDLLPHQTKHKIQRLQTYILFCARLYTVHVWLHVLRVYMLTETNPSLQGRLNIQPIDPSSRCPSSIC